MVIPVVVEMRVASIIERATRAAVEVETAMRPERDTGGTFWNSLISGCRVDRVPSTRFVHFSCVGDRWSVEWSARMG